jgi:hypothetical protein
LDYDEEFEATDETSLDDLAVRLDELESRLDSPRSHFGSSGLPLLYALGMTIAVVLSWARNASILWCVLHGLLSWAYVIYFAATR